jgi:hypothetical protein
LGWRQLFEEKQLHIAMEAIVSNRLKLYFESINKRNIGFGFLEIICIKINVFN